MVSYDVDTNRRPLIYFGLAASSIVFAPKVASQVRPFLPDALVNYGFSGAVSPFIIFSLALAVFNLWLWRLPGIHIVSGIPDLRGTWEGPLKRIGCSDRPPDGGNVECTIKQTWQNIDFDFKGPPIDSAHWQGSHSTTGRALTAAVFVKNGDPMHVRYIYAVQPMNQLEPDNLDYRAGEGAAVLYFSREPHTLQGTYYSDKRRCGNVRLRRTIPPRWWSPR